MTTILGPIIESTRYVTPDNGPRPAGKPTECFYCHELVGQPHRDDCVCYVRKVRIRMTVSYEVTYPVGYPIESLEFARNEGSWCSSNAIDELNERFGDDSGTCMCYSDAEFEVIDWVDELSPRPQT